MTPRDWYDAARTAASFHTQRFTLHWVFALMSALVVLGGGYVFVLAPPANFPTGAIAVVTRGERVSEVARVLEARHIVAHASVLRFLLRASMKDDSVRAGAYRFVAPANALEIAYRLATGGFGIPPEHITLVEGQTARQMAAKIAEVFPEVSASDFIAAGEPYEGYLFPDTYSFAPDVSAADIVAAMRANFAARVMPLSADIAASGRSLSDIVVMASILEKEANTPEDMRMVAGILWNRIRLGMPLQADAVFGYIRARATYSPSYADLKIDSPYNTYTNRGLPPGPISNPGFIALEAALHPAQTKYLYYLTGKDGLMRYAATYAGHQANLAKYLK